MTVKWDRHQRPAAEQGLTVNLKERETRATSSGFYSCLVNESCAILNNLGISFFHLLNRYLLRPAMWQALCWAADAGHTCPICMSVLITMIIMLHSMYDWFCTHYWTPIVSHTVGFTPFALSWMLTIVSLSRYFVVEEIHIGMSGEYYQEVVAGETTSENRTILSVWKESSKAKSACLFDSLTLEICLLALEVAS